MAKEDDLPSDQLKDDFTFTEDETTALS